MNKKILKRAKYLYMPALFIIIGIPIFIFAGGLEDNILFAEVQYVLSIESGNVSFDYTKIPPKTSGKIDFKVASVNDYAHGRVYGQRACARDGVVHLNELNLERADGNFVAGFYNVHLHTFDVPMFLELLCDQCQR